MKGVMFFMQYKSMGSSSRGIQSGGRIFDIEDICNISYMNSILRGSYNLMYQVGNDRLLSLKSMRLEEFEQIFVNTGHLKNIKYLLGFGNMPGFGVVESPFRKEILDKYGINAYKPKVSTTTKYNAGQVITGADSVRYIYFGEYKRIALHEDKKLKEEFSGHLYIPLDTVLRKYKCVTLSDLTTPSNEVMVEFIANYVNNIKNLRRYFLKTKKKAIRIWGESIDMSPVTCCEVQTSTVQLPKTFMYNYIRNIQVTYEQ